MLCFEAILLLARFIEKLSSKFFFLQAQCSDRRKYQPARQNKHNSEGLPVIQNRLNISTALSLYISVSESEKNRDVPVFHLILGRNKKERKRAGWEGWKERGRVKGRRRWVGVSTPVPKIKFLYRRQLINSRSSFKGLGRWHRWWEVFLCSSTTTWKQSPVPTYNLGTVLCTWSHGTWEIRDRKSLLPSSEFSEKSCSPN